MGSINSANPRAIGFETIPREVVQILDRRARSTIKNLISLRDMVAESPLKFGHPHIEDIRPVTPDLERNELANVCWQFVRFNAEYRSSYDALEAEQAKICANAAPHEDNDYDQSEAACEELETPFLRRWHMSRRLRYDDFFLPDDEVDGRFWFSNISAYLTPLSSVIAPRHTRQPILPWRSDQGEQDASTMAILFDGAADEVKIQTEIARALDSFLKARNKRNQATQESWDKMRLRKCMPLMEYVASYILQEDLKLDPISVQMICESLFPRRYEENAERDISARVESFKRISANAPENFFLSFQESRPRARKRENCQERGSE